MSRELPWKTIGSGALLLALAAAVVAPVNAARFGYRVANAGVLVIIDGVELGRFDAVDGLSIEQEVIEFRDGSDPSVIRKLPGMVKYGNLTLKRGIVRGDAMWEWIQASFDPGGEVLRKNGTLIVFDHRGRKTAGYNFFRAWPAKWTAPAFDADANDVAIEEIVLAIEAWEEG